MADEADSGDTASEKQRPSKRDRFFGALSKARTKSKKADKDSKSNDKLSDDVEEFLQTGRTSTSTSDSVPHLTSTPSTKRDPHSTGRKETPNSDVEDFLRTGRPPTADSLQPHPSSRKIPVPKIDVSRSQRWPGQQAVGSDNSTAMLGPPAQQIRSHSQGSMPRRGRKPRNLSVSFLEAPPVIIGEGGDEAEAPPNEISRRARARSVSPMPKRLDDGHGSSMPGHSAPLKRKPVPPPETRPAAVQQELVPKPLSRIATGWSPMTPIAQTPADIEFAMTLQPGSSPVSPEKVLLPPFQPKQSADENKPFAAISGTTITPQRLPTRDPSPTRDHRPAHSLKPSIAREDLRMQFEEGQALRHGHSRDLSNTSTNNIPTSTTAVDPESFQKLSIRDTGPAFDEASSKAFASAVAGSPPASARVGVGNGQDDPPGGWV